MKLAHKLRSRKGFTLVELLTTMILMGMVSATITQALSFFYTSYIARTGDIEAQLLCETVSMLVQDDLTKKAYSDTAPTYSGSADAYIDGVTLDEAAYGHGTRTVTITVTPDDTNRLYSVTVSVANNASTVASAASNTFTVRPLG